MLVSRVQKCVLPWTALSLFNSTYTLLCTSLCKYLDFCLNNTLFIACIVETNSKQPTKRKTKRTIFCLKYLHLIRTQSSYMIYSSRDHHQGKRIKWYCIKVNILFGVQLLSTVLTEMSTRTATAILCIKISFHFSASIVYAVFLDTLCLRKVGNARTRTYYVLCNIIWFCLPDDCPLMTETCRNAFCSKVM